MIGSPHPATEPTPRNRNCPRLHPQRGLPVFFLTTSLMFVVLMLPLLFTDLHDLFRLECLVACAALGVEETQEFLKSVGVRRVPQKRALRCTLTRPSFFSLSRWWESVELGMSSSSWISPDHQTLRVCREQQLHDAQPRLGPHRGKHVGIPGHLIGVLASRFIFPYLQKYGRNASAPLPPKPWKCGRSTLSEPLSEICSLRLAGRENYAFLRAPPFQEAPTHLLQHQTKINTRRKSAGAPLGNRGRTLASPRSNSPQSVII